MTDAQLEACRKFDWFFENRSLADRVSTAIANVPGITREQFLMLSSLCEKALKEADDEADYEKD